jgi:uridine kinase
VPDTKASPNSIRPGAPREHVQARLPDGRILEAPPNTPLADILHAANGAGEPPAIAAVLNGKLVGLAHTLKRDADVTPITPDSLDGMRIYRRSLVFLLVAAAAELFPEAEVFVEHSAATGGGYFCEIRGRALFTQSELGQIEALMREMVMNDEPFTRREVSVAEAIKLFRERGQTDTAQLMAHRSRETVRLHSLRGRADYVHGYLAPSTGHLRHFALHAFPPGLILQFPPPGQPETLPPITPYPKLFEVFEEAGHWLERLGIRNAGALNDAISEGRLPEISLVSEALHESRIARIAADIAEQRDRVRVVLIAGPSASGKTTFAKRLAVQLLANGLRPFPLGIDDYFVDREQTPRDAEGQYDYESLQAVDVALLNEHLLKLMKGETTQLRHYNFLSGQGEPGSEVTLGAENLIIVEGIHGLNPALVPGLPSECLYRIYVSALTELNLDRHNRVSTTDCRLIRRIVRDVAARGYSAAQTLRRWKSVTRGERLHIFPFQENCDAIFNSALVHELAVLRPLAEPQLLQVRPDSPDFLEANRLLSFLQWFRPAPPEAIPSNSILREFIGGSILANFRMWPTA